MKKIKIYIILPILILIVNCGYTPLLDTNQINFYIGDIKLNGDRHVNNYLSDNFKKHQRNGTNKNRYDLNISSSYEKSITNKDKNGNPKNYTLKLKLDVEVKNKSGKINRLSYEKKGSLSAQDKKLRENELEKKYKKDLADSLSKDIIFYLMSQ